MLAVWYTVVVTLVRQGYDVDEILNGAKGGGAAGAGEEDGVVSWGYKWCSCICHCVG